jgi:hypothetical protein
MTSSNGEKPLIYNYDVEGVIYSPIFVLTLVLKIEDWNDGNSLVYNEIHFYILVTFVNPPSRYGCRGPKKTVQR